MTQFYGFCPDRIIAKHSKSVKVSVFTYADTNMSSWCVDIRSSRKPYWVSCFPWIRIQMLSSSRDFISVTLVTKAHSSFQPPWAIYAFYRRMTKRFSCVKYIWSLLCKSRSRLSTTPWCMVSFLHWSIWFPFPQVSGSKYLRALMVNQSSTRPDPPHPHRPLWPDTGVRSLMAVTHASASALKTCCQTELLNTQTLAQQKIH